MLHRWSLKKCIRRIGSAPKLYKSGEKFSIPLDGYETAIFEIYPVDEATVPLVAGVTFDVLSSGGSEYSIQYHNASMDAKLLNPSIVKSIKESGIETKLNTLSIKTESTPEIIAHPFVKTIENDRSKLEDEFTLSETAKKATLVVLLTPDSTISVKTKPSLIFSIDGKESIAKTEEQEGKSQWYKVDVQPGTHHVSIQIMIGKNEKTWSGKSLLWMIAQQQQTTKEITFTLYHDSNDRIMPPHPWKVGEIRLSVPIGEGAISVPMSKLNEIK